MGCKLGWEGTRETAEETGVREKPEEVHVLRESLHVNAENEGRLSCDSCLASSRRDKSPFDTEQLSGLDDEMSV